MTMRKLMSAWVGAVAGLAILPAGALATPPVIESESATNVTSTDATLNAAINTQGLETGYWFQIYTNDTYQFTRPDCPFKFEECLSIIVGEPLLAGLVEPEPAYIPAGSGTQS